jgi:NAD(P)-dependent dehydrogenase (short-subunit alcohol dehydrogenase family)
MPRASRGLIGLTQTLAAEFGPQNVRVNTILPGAVDTDMYREMNNTPDKTAFITNLHALKRVGRPEEVARSVLYLASDDSAFVYWQNCLLHARAGYRSARPVAAAQQIQLATLGTTSDVGQPKSSKNYKLLMSNGY